MIRSGVVAGLAALVLVGDVVGLAVVGQRADGPTAASPSADAPSGDPTRAEESLEEQLARVLDHVEQLRGLTFPQPPAVRYATRAELGSEVAEQIEEYTVEDADLDQRLLVALGQLEVGIDLRELLITAYSEQVGGYYDPETAELVVGTNGDAGARVSRLDEVTLAHELAHSLVDAVVGLPDLEAAGEPTDGVVDADGVAALAALVEGDATALMNQYAEVAMSPIDGILLMQETLEMLEELAEALSRLPASLQRGLEFPYVEGEGFVRALLDRGGWSAVDAAYAAPPRTTLEVLDPDRYGTFEPRPPAPFGTPGEAWGEPDRTATFGAYDLLLLLQLPGNDPLAAIDGARRLAVAWEGGLVRQWSDGAATAVAIHLAHDPATDLCKAVMSWYLGAFPGARSVPEAEASGLDLAVDGEQQDAVVACDDDGIRVGIAPDVATAERAIGG